MKVDSSIPLPKEVTEAFAAIEVPELEANYHEFGGVPTLRLSIGIYHAETRVDPMYSVGAIVRLVACRYQDLIVMRANDRFLYKGKAISKLPLSDPIFA